MTTEQTEEIIVAFIRDELGESGAEELEPEDNLLTSGLVDSVGVLRLIGHLEGELGVKVPPDELVPDNFRSVRVMAGFMAGLAD